MAIDFNPEDLITPIGRDDINDGFLRLLVGCVNKFGIQIPITLHAHGMLISGIVIANHKFFEAERNKIINGSPKDDDAGSALAEVFQQWQTRMEQENADPDKDVFDDRVTFIHLREAQFFVPGQAPIPQRPIHWRAKLAEISGFSLGQLAVDPS
ncbi:hypothetical protein [Mesorhizobium sp. B2-8-5]|uniref:hypothetical protein n=1 Tax=Mesorhizobium sp. B2-8-5 TaxID=2589903 RepID=UPI00112C57D3|nr:hypothetical protein [Mesorhizobium sp. B2-8-5]UCI24002.1 hypothetical protein FJ430_20615 [Mesorhizobium sp. B2-8-5]